MSRRHILAALLPLFATGCVYNLAPEKMFYPPSWPQLRPIHSSSCEDFVGVYNAKGVSAQSLSNGARTPTLFALLGLLGPNDAPYVWVQSSYEGKESSVVALNSAREPIQLTGIAEPIACRSGNLVRSIRRSNDADGASHKSEESITISLAVDGSLVAHVVGSSRTNDLLNYATKNIDVLYKFTRTQ